MPAKSKKQLAHLCKLNALSQVIKNQFKKDSIPHNKIHYQYRYNSEGKRLNPVGECPFCKKTQKSIYAKACRKCSYVIRSESRKKRVWKNGYLYEQRGNRPKPVHIEKAEKALGRKLKQNEVVHHINMHGDDARNCNLLICDNKYHKWLHCQYETFLAGRFSYVPSGI